MYCLTLHKQIAMKLEKITLANLSNLMSQILKTLVNLKKMHLNIHITGYLIRKLNLQEYQSKENSFTWVDEVAKGALKKPSNDFFEKIKKLEKIFYIRNGDKISHDPNIHQDLVQCSNSIDLADNIKSLFFKCRIHFRIQRLNLNNKQE